MDPSADLPQPTTLDGDTAGSESSPEAAHVEFTTGWKGRSAEFDSAVNEVYSLIEGRPMGSVESKAFCDFADSVDAEHWMNNFPKEQRSYWEMRKALVDETIRQRRNELPGYDQRNRRISEGFARMTESHPVRRGSYRGQEMSFLYSRDELMAMKYHHLSSANGNQPPSSPPVQPAPSV